MAERTIQSGQPFAPDALTASSVGTWEYELTEDRLRYDPALAALYGLPTESCDRGITMARLVETIHPDDRAAGLAKRLHMRRHGGVFVIEYRVFPAPGVMRWLLVRGRYAPDPDGRVRRGRGIVVDVTESKHEGFVEGELFFLTGIDEGTATALDQAGRHALEARKAIDAVGGAHGPRLRAAADALMVEIGLHIAAALPFFTSKDVRH